MNMDLKTLSNNLKLLRKVYGISQEELSAAIHLARSTYSAYETGAKSPDLQTVDALAALYNIGFDSLVNYNLSEGFINRIYFDSKDEHLADLLNDYQSLSVVSKNLILENLNILMDREAAFFKEYGTLVSKKKRHDKIDGKGNGEDGSHGT